jgi:hypothetical protein
MKPYPNYKGNKLTNINPTAIALVTEGANRKKFCLFKIKLNTEGSPMKKELALALIKSGNLSEDEQKLVLADVAEADKAEVQKAIDGLKKSSDNELDVEKLAVSVAGKIVKAMEGQLTQISETLKSTVTALEKLGTKPVEKDNDPELTDDQVRQALADAAKEEGK